MSFPRFSCMVDGDLLRHSVHLRFYGPSGIPAEHLPSGTDSFYFFCYPLPPYTAADATTTHAHTAPPATDSAPAFPPHQHTADGALHSRHASRLSSPVPAAVLALSPSSAFQRMYLGARLPRALPAPPRRRAAGYLRLRTSCARSAAYTWVLPRGRIPACRTLPPVPRARAPRWRPRRSRAAPAACCLYAQHRRAPVAATNRCRRATCCCTLPATSGLYTASLDHLRRTVCLLALHISFAPRASSSFMPSRRFPGPFAPAPAPCMPCSFAPSSISLVFFYRYYMPGFCPSWTVPPTARWTFPPPTTTRRRFSRTATSAVHFCSWDFSTTCLIFSHGWLDSFWRFSWEGPAHGAADSWTFLPARRHGRF